MTEVIQLPTAAQPDNGNGALWPTPTAQGIRSVVEACRLGRQLGLITGPSGVGKTTAARAAVAACADEDHGAQARCLMMTRAAEGLQPGLLRLAQAVGELVTPHMGGNDLYDALAARYWPQGSLLVLDEAQFMSDALLHAVRNLWDELDARGRAPGIVLVGTPDLAERIKGCGARKSREFEPLRGRLGAAVELDALDAADFAAVCRHYGLAGAQAAALVERAGRSRGGLHNVRRLVTQAQGAAGAGKPIGFSDLKRAAELAGVAS